MRKAPFNVRRAAWWVAAVLVSVAFVGAVAVRLFDGDEFPTFGSGLWWSLQTITTVGYGDHVPAQPEGQIVAAIIMVSGIGLVTVINAAISAAFIDAARRRRGRSPDDLILERLERMERMLEELKASASSGPGDAG